MNEEILIVSGVPLSCLICSKVRTEEDKFEICNACLNEIQKICYKRK